MLPARHGEIVESLVFLNVTMFFWEAPMSGNLRLALARCSLL